MNSVLQFSAPGFMLHVDILSIMKHFQSIIIKHGRLYPTFSDINACSSPSSSVITAILKPLKNKPEDSSGVVHSTYAFHKWFCAGK
jgi:hypothetical protein